MELLRLLLLSIESHLDALDLTLLLLEFFFKVSYFSLLVVEYLLCAPEISADVLSIILKEFDLLLVTPSLPLFVSDDFVLCLLSSC